MRIFPEIVPTPFVPSALQCFRGEIGLGVMVTASHNPKKDNGYKVYGSNGAQIVDSVAKEICEYIKMERGGYEAIKKGKSFEIDPEDSFELMEKVSGWYIDKLKGFLKGCGLNKETTPRVVYTALHGVGGDYIDKVFSSLFGVDKVSKCVRHVDEQRRPDPEFPTVEFPNPEEGASTLKLAMEEATRQGIQHVFANDPDADRFCVAERDEQTGLWRIFNGNEIAVLLADFVASKVGGDDVDCVMLASCVSSRFLGNFCSRRAWRFESTSTGFKNLGNRGIQLKEGGARVLFAYEEAIGFQVGDWNFDKDGISAMMTFYALLLEICDSNDSAKYCNDIAKCSFDPAKCSCDPAKCSCDPVKYNCDPVKYNCDPDMCNCDPVKCNYDPVMCSASPLLSKLKSIYKQEAVWPVQFNGYYICKPASRIKSILKSVKHPEEEDDCIFSNDGSVITLEYPSRRTWLMLRSSGTEPKLKYYSEMLGEGEMGEAEKMEFEGKMRGVIEKLIEPEKNELKQKK